MSLREMMSAPIRRDRVFKHRFLPRIDITSRDTPNGRFYFLPDGTFFPSVTTVLGKLSREGLAEWRERVGEQVAEEIRHQAAGRGTAVHHLCEQYVLNSDDLGVGAMPANITTFRQLQEILSARVGTIYGIEYPLYSEYLGTAGRCDLICEFDGITSIVDFKTSRRIKDESYVLSYFLQATAYALMAQERNPGLIIPQIVVLIAVDHEKPHVFVKKTGDYVAMVREVFQDE